MQVKLFLDLAAPSPGSSGCSRCSWSEGRSCRTTRRCWDSRGIAVAFLAQNNPIGIIFAAIVWAVLSRGETAVQLETDLPREFVIILQGILIISVVVVYQIAKRRLARRELQRAGAEVGLRDTATPEASREGEA